MKNAKQIIPAMLFIPVILLLIVVGCNKEFTKNTDLEIEDPTEVSMESLKVSSDFDWRFNDNITINITSVSSAIIKITSEDGNTSYYKGSHPGNNEVEHIDLNVPRSINSLLVNGNSVYLTGADLDVDLSSLKGASIVNKSILFDGSDDYGKIISDVLELNSVSEFTIEAWVKQSDVTGNALLLRKFKNNNRDIYIRTAGGDFYIEIGDGTNNTYVYWDDYGTTMTDNTWFHFAVVYDGSEFAAADRVILYINGVSVGSLIPSFDDIPAMTYNLGGKPTFIAGSTTTADLNGSMDELRIWDIARLETDILTNMNTELFDPELIANLIAYYKFDEYAFSPADDEIEDLSFNTYAITLYNDYSLVFDYPFGFDTDGDGIEDVDDDYPDDADRAFDNYFPALGFYSLAFEDLWPGKGDYDFNDVVVDYRFQTVTNAQNFVVEIFGVFPVKASGAFLHNGFGFNLPNSIDAFTNQPKKFVVTGYDVQESYVDLNAYGHEKNQSKATVIVFDDIFNVLGEPSQGMGINTSWMPFVEYDTVRITITTGTWSFKPRKFKLNQWNPFIIVGQNRGHEVHLPDYAPTDLMNFALFGTEEDDSDVLKGRYFKTIFNLPWAIDVPAEFDWPIEKKEIVWAYKHFAEWVESSGTLYPNWYEDFGGYRFDDYIYMTP